MIEILCSAELPTTSNLEYLAKFANARRSRDREIRSLSLLIMENSAILLVFQIKLT